MGVERLEDTEDADPVAVIAQRVMAQIGIGGDHPARRPERLGRHVEGEEFQRRHDPQRDPGAAGPGDLRAFGLHRPVIAVVVHAVAAQGIAEVIVGQSHGLTSPHCAPRWRRRNRRNGGR